MHPEVRRKFQTAEGSEVEDVVHQVLWIGIRASNKALYVESFEPLPLPAQMSMVASALEGLQAAHQDLVIQSALRNMASGGLLDEAQAGRALGGALRGMIVRSVLGSLISRGKLRPEEADALMAEYGCDKASIDGRRVMPVTDVSVEQKIAAALQGRR